ncbi:MAG: OmpA family protein [Neomegalonema sp.]|nr:OmpA family protein [Neomegalonema sp.]
MKAIFRMIVAGGALALAGCSSLPGANLGDTFTMESFLNRDLPGGSYTNELAKAYQAEAALEVSKDTNWYDATAFKAKAEAAAAGETVMPWDPAAYGLDGQIATGYQETLSALKFKEARPAACARMVAAFDHWVEQSREGSHSITPAGTAQGAWAGAHYECTGGIAPMAAVAKSWTVYFGFDRSNLTAQARSVLNEVVESVRGLSSPLLSIVGHTDTAGSVGYNQGLSERRANTVANALSAAGVDMGTATLAGRSEKQLAVPTADGVAEPLNRRVEIQLGK